MAITIELQPEHEARIAIEARKRGLSVEEYLARAIAGCFLRSSRRHPHNGEARLKNRFGRFELREFLLM